MVLIADAGYPKNLEQSLESRKNVHLFHAGMGNVIGGYSSNPDYHKYFYAFPAPNIGHGCILEVMVLAFEKLYTAYSHGRGNITLQSMEIMHTMAVKHGIVRAPFYNTIGLWSDKIQPQPKEISWTK